MIGSILFAPSLVVLIIGVFYKHYVEIKKEDNPKNDYTKKFTISYIIIGIGLLIGIAGIILIIIQ